MLFNRFNSAEKFIVHKKIAKILMDRADKKNRRNWSVWEKRQILIYIPVYSDLRKEKKTFILFKINTEC